MNDPGSAVDRRVELRRDVRRRKRLHAVRRGNHRRGPGLDAKRVDAEQRAHRQRPARDEVLIRQVAVIGELRVRLFRRVDHAVLLHQDDVAAEQLAGEREQIGMRGEREERVVVDERTPRRQRVADGGHALGTAELLHLARHHAIESIAELGDGGGGEAARHDRVADQADAAGQRGRRRCSSAACSTMPYLDAVPSIALPATVTSVEQIVPCRHAREPRAAGARPRAADRADARPAAPSRPAPTSIEPDDRQLAEPARRRAVDRARAHSGPRAGRVGTQQAGGLARAKTDRAARPRARAAGRRDGSRPRDSAAAAVGRHRSRAAGTCRVRCGRPRHDHLERAERRRRRAGGLPRRAPRGRRVRARCAGANENTWSANSSSRPGRPPSGQTRTSMPSAASAPRSPRRNASGSAVCSMTFTDTTRSARRRPGRSAAVPCHRRRPGAAPCATLSADGSQPARRAAGQRSPSASSSDPLPQPTSSTRAGGRGTRLRDPLGILRLPARSRGSPGACA